MGNLSKYRQSLIKVSVNESIYGSKEIYKSLDEVIEKAEKYDEVVEYVCELACYLCIPEEVKLEHIKEMLKNSIEALKRIEELEQEIKKIKENI